MATNVVTATQTHVVQITVASGDFDYGPNRSILVRRGDTIEWRYNGNFAVHIGWNSPCEKGRYRGKNAIRAKLLPTPLPGHYKYSVAVLADGEIFTDDPELIVKR
jgi:hypothetical protein